MRVPGHLKPPWNTLMKQVHKSIHDRMDSFGKCMSHEKAMPFNSIGNQLAMTLASTLAATMSMLYKARKSLGLVLPSNLMGTTGQNLDAHTTRLRSGAKARHPL